MLLFLLSIIETQEDRDKFTLIYERYYKLLIDIALGILHNGEDAEDAVQQTFIKLIPNLGKIEDVSCRQTINYLVIMVRRVCFDLYNEQKKIVHIPYEDLSENEMNCAENPLWEEMEYLELLDRVKALPDIYGDVLYLIYCENYTPKEVADTLGMTVKATQKRIERARQQLKALLSATEVATA